MHERERDLIFLSFFPFLFHSFSLSFFYSDTQAFTHTFSLSLLTISLSLIHSLLSLCHTHTHFLSLFHSHTHAFTHSFSLSLLAISLSLSLCHTFFHSFLFTYPDFYSLFFFSLSLSSHTLSHTHTSIPLISLSQTLYICLSLHHTVL